MGREFAEQTLTQAALEQLMSTLSLARKGDLSARMKARDAGVTQVVADDLNGILETQSRVNAELARVAEALARGDLQTRASVQGCEGDWDVPVQQLNAVAVQYTRHCAELRRVVKSVTAGDFTRHMATGDGSNHRGGDAQRTADELNKLISHLNLIVNEATQAVATMGLDGRLGAKVQLPDASGSWGLLAGSLNAMTASLAEQVNDLTETAHAYSRGNFSARATAACHGDMQALKQALNRTGEHALDLCEELVRVSDDWLQKGQVGGQVRASDATGDVRHATDATNALLARLSNEMQQLSALARSLAAGGDIELSPDPDARGLFSQTRADMAEAGAQVARVKAVIGGLVSNRFPAIEAGGTEADMALFRLGVRLKREWFGAARSGLLDARRVAESLPEFCSLALARAAASADAELAALYTVEDGVVRMVASLGTDADPQSAPPIKVGEGLVGRVAATGEPILLTDLNEHGLRARTGLLEVAPAAVLLMPVTYESDPVAVLELGFVRQRPEAAQEMLDFLSIDLAEGILEAMQFEGGRRSSRTVGVPEERLREVSEELTIASARVERLTRELHTRDVALRDLQQEVDLLRDAPTDADSPDGAVIPSDASREATG